MSEIYYVMAGDGSVTIGSETAQIHSGDAVPVRLGGNPVVCQFGQRTARIDGLWHRQLHGGETGSYGEQTPASLTRPT